MLFYRSPIFRSILILIYEPLKKSFHQRLHQRRIPSTSIGKKLPLLLWYSSQNGQGVPYRIWGRKNCHHQKENQKILWLWKLRSILSPSKQKELIDMPLWNWQQKDQRWSYYRLFQSHPLWIIIDHIWNNWKNVSRIHRIWENWWL